MFRFPQESYPGCWQVLSPTRRERS